MIDNPDKVKGVRRQLLALANDVHLDPEDLVDVFAQLRSDLAEAERVAVTNLRAKGRSWYDLAAALGVSRPAVQKRFSGVS